jgi:hypothetical protein
MWGAVVGAVGMVIVGFWQMGWTTEGAADRMAWDRVDSAVVAVLVPYCVADAERDPDLAKLVKVKAEQSSYGRAQLVSDAGWATRPGRTTPDRRLASECSDKLRVTHIPPPHDPRLGVASRPTAVKDR